MVGSKTELEYCKLKYRSISARHFKQRYSSKLSLARKVGRKGREKGEGREEGRKGRGKGERRRKDRGGRGREEESKGERGRE